MDLNYKLFVRVVAIVQIGVIIIWPGYMLWWLSWKSEEMLPGFRTKKLCANAIEGLAKCTYFEGCHPQSLYKIALISVCL